MKKILSILAVALAVTVWYAIPAAAAKVDLGGHVEARGYYIQSVDSMKDHDENWLDAKFRLDAKINQGMTTGVVQVDFLSASMAHDGDTTGYLVLGNDTGNSYDLFRVRQAYLAVNFPVMTLVGGRYEVKLGNGLVMNDTVDLVAVVAPVGPVNLLVGYLLMGENDAPLPAANPAGRDIDLTTLTVDDSAADDTAFALKASLDNIAGSGFNAGFFTVFAHLRSVSSDTDLQVYGLTGDGKAGPVDLSAEVNIFGGEVSSDTNFEGTNFMLSGGLAAGSVGLPVGLSAAILYASGQDSSANADLNINTIDGDFRAGNILVRDDFNNYEGVSSLGFGSGDINGDDVADISYLVGGPGLMAIKIAANMPSIDFAGMMHSPELGLIWAQTSEDVIVDSKKETDLGIEIYANTNCEVDKNLAMNVGIGYLLAGDAWGTDPEDQLKLEASLIFHF